LQNREYTSAQRSIHWWVAILIAGQFLSQKSMRASMDRVDAEATPALADFLITSVHSLVGLSLLFLMIWRWRLRSRHPVSVGGGVLSPAWAGLARVWHLALYLSVGWMAVTGALSYYLEFSAAQRWHELGKWVLGMLVIGHMLAGMAHWLIFRDRVLHGMLGKARDADTIRSSDQSLD